MRAADAYTKRANTVPPTIRANTADGRKTKGAEHHDERF